MTDRTELKRLAEAATAGPWYQHGGIMQVLNHDCETVCETFEDDGECPDAQFIAAANPAAVLALIAENERLRVDLKSVVRLNNENADLFKAKNDQIKAENEQAKFISRLAYNFDGYKAVLDERDQLRAEVAGLKTGYEAYERVNAELKAEVEALRKAGFADAFYKVSEAVGVTGARAVSPMQVFEAEILPAIEAAVKDAERYRFVSQLAWYVDQAAYIYDVGNQKAVWSDQREAVDADQIEDAIDEVMREEPTQ
ncbi:ead/Ea22-like family protein [Pseudomonas sp. G.S.17]|uniref:ead/Ea22-like family protein n=1 Tax=Pseudomonas sp. G.S.17 TaxID=3137451 RepID=UPI00311CA783